MAPKTLIVIWTVLFLGLSAFIALKGHADEILDPSSSEEVLIGLDILLPPGVELDKTDLEIELQGDGK